MCSQNFARTDYLFFLPFCLHLKGAVENRETVDTVSPVLQMCRGRHNPGRVRFVSGTLTPQREDASVRFCCAYIFKTICMDCHLGTCDSPPFLWTEILRQPEILSFTITKLRNRQTGTQKLSVIHLSFHWLIRVTVRGVEPVLLFFIPILPSSLLPIFVN